MSSFKKFAKIMDNHTNGSIRLVYKQFLIIKGLKTIFTSRKIVKKIVGKKMFTKIKKLKLVTFPNHLQSAEYLIQDGYALEKIFKVFGIRSRQFTPWEDFDIFINWQDLTHNIVNTKKYINDSYAYTGKHNWDKNSVLINFNCDDISKRKIGEINFTVFGYPLDINPTKYNGIVVSKSDANSKHDGVLIKCPIEISKIEIEKVYSIAVDNRDGDEVIDFRVPYINGLVGFFYEKRRPLSSRFSNRNSRVIIRELVDEFSKQELKKIDKFCEKLGANYGEFDILRDRQTGKIYIVDFAKTPAGPPNGLKQNEKIKAIERMSIAFANNMFKSLL